MPEIPIQFPSGAITKAMIKAGAGIEASKFVRHQSIDTELFVAGATVTALTKDIHIVRGAIGTMVGFQAAICGAIATGTDRTVTVDLQKSTGGAAFATVLSSTIGFTNASTLRTAVAAVFSATSLVAGDILRIVITVAGSDAAQATGLVATLIYEEEYA